MLQLLNALAVANECLLVRTALSHLKDQDGYMQRRKAVGKVQRGAREGKTDETVEAEPKAKAKSQASGNQAEA